MSIHWRAFTGCERLTKITIPDSVTSIGGAAFVECDKLSSITIPVHFGKQLNEILNKKMIDVIHIDDISNVSSKYRPGCAVGFAEDNRSLTDEYGKKYAKYIKANAAKLIDAAMKYPALFYLMISEKLISAKDLETVTKTVQARGKAEYISAILEYRKNSVSEKDKAKVGHKQ